MGLSFATLVRPNIHPSNETALVFAHETLNTWIFPIVTTFRPFENKCTCIVTGMFMKEFHVLPKLFEQTDVCLLSLDTVWFVFVDGVGVHDNVT